MTDWLNRVSPLRGGHYVEVLRAVSGGDTGWFQSRNVVLWIVGSFSPGLFCICPLSDSTLSRQGGRENRSPDRQYFLQRKLSVCVSKLCPLGHATINKGFQEAAEGHGARPDGLHLYGQMTPGWEEFREPDRKTIDGWVTAC